MLNEADLKGKQYCVWWNYEGIIEFERVPIGVAINVQLYSEQLEQVHLILAETNPSLTNCKRILLEQDKLQEKKIKKMGRIELLPHSA